MDILEAIRMTYAEEFESLEEMRKYRHRSDFKRSEFDYQLRRCYAILAALELVASRVGLHAQLTYPEA